MNLKKLLSAIIVGAMCICALAFTASAEDEPVYYAKLAGVETYFENVSDAFTEAGNPDGKSVMLLKDCEQDIVISDGGAYTFYLEGFTVTGMIKTVDGTVHINGKLGSDVYGTIQNTGIDGNYPIYNNQTSGGNNFDLTNCNVIATAEGGTAIYADGEKINVIAANVEGNIKAANGGLINITTGTFDDELVEEGNGIINVSGGTFTEDPTDFVSAGYRVVNNEDTYVVKASADVTVDEAFEKDEDGAYLLKDADDVELFRLLINTQRAKVSFGGKTFKLADDIDLAGRTLALLNDDNHRFGGTFDGQGHTIYNMTIDGGDASYVGFFGVTYTATIKNVTFENVNVSGGAYTAAVVGFTRTSTATTFEGVEVKGNINISGGAHTAGVVGGGRIDVSDCTVSGNEGSVIEGSFDVAGIAGLVSQGSEKVNGNAVEGISITSSDGIVGGIAGRVITSGMTIESNSVSDVEIVCEDGATYSDNYGLIIGATDVRDDGIAKYGNNTVEDSTLTVAGEEKTVLYCPIDYDGDDYSANVAEPIATVDGEFYYSFEEAIDAAAEASKPVELLPGEIVLDAKQLIINKSVTIKGATASTRSTDKATTIVATGATGYVVASATDGVTFENIGFVAAEDFTGEYWMTGSNMNCVANSSVLCALGKVTVSDCSFVNNGNATTAVWLAGDSTGKFGKAGINAADSSVTNCEITGFPRGVEMQGDNIPCGNTVVTGNTFTKVDEPLSMYWGVNNDGASSVTFTGNTIVSALTEGEVPMVALWNYAFEMGNATDVEFNISGNSAPEDTEFVITNTVTGNITTDVEIIRNYSNPAFAEECAADGEEFYLYYDKDWRTEAEMTADGIEYTKIAEGTEMVAFVDGVYYDTLQKAFNAAEDGDEILLVSDAEDTTGTKIEKDVIVNLNSYTYTSTGNECNNRCFLVTGSANVTIKNGTIVAKGETVDNTVWGAASGTGAYGSVRMESTGTLYLTDIITYNYRGWGSNVKACSGKTICTNVDIYAEYGGGFEAAGGEVELNNCSVEQEGTYNGPFNSAAVSVSTNGKMTVNGGNYSTTPISEADANNQGTTHGSWTIVVMNSGGTMIINDGTFSNDNYGDNELATYARSLINIGALSDATSSVVINGGEFTSLSETLISVEYGGGTESAAVQGGTFNVDPTAYLAEGFVPVTTADGKYAVADEANVLDTIKVEFVKVDAENPEEELLYNINLTAYDGEVINRLNSGDLTFVLTKDENDYGANKYQIIDIAGDNIAVNPVDDNGRYEFHFTTKTDVENDTNKTITIAQVKFTGYGKFSFGVKDVTTNAAHATTIVDNVVDTFVPNPDTAKNEGTLDVSAKLENLEIAVPTRELKVVIDFPNAVENKAVAYQNMTFKLTGDDLASDLVIKLGERCEIFIDDDEEKPNADVSAKFENGAYEIVITGLLIKDNTYNAEVSGLGYRTAYHTVKMTDAKVLEFWNNVKDVAKAVEYIVKEEASLEANSEVLNTNFLAGDIVHDGKINVYDLSAVVSYFGEKDIAKYDLNRDGKIDSKDVAYVLVSWNK